MRAFRAQWLGLGHDRKFRHQLVWGGHRVAVPADVVAIQRELLGPWKSVIEDGHAARAHHSEFLLFKGIEPRHVDLRAQSPWKDQARERGVGDAGCQVGTAGAADRGRQGRARE